MRTVAYWDASAVLSFLLKDVNTDKAKICLDEKGYHYISTLAYSEVHSVLSRLKKEKLITDLSFKKACIVLGSGLWRPIESLPSWDLFQRLALKWPLRGADLWHLAMAKTLKVELPEIVVLSFDNNLNIACEGEGLLTTKML